MAEAAGSASDLAASQVARTAYGRILAYLAYQFRDIAAAEDALAEAFASALKHWPEQGVPDSPEGWLMTAARRNLLQLHRHALVEQDPATVALLDDSPAASDVPGFPDERLKLLFACAHPAIDASIHTALMLQTVLGIEADKIAAAFLVSPAAMAQRLVRAKAKIKLAGIRFEVPEPDDLSGRLHAVLEAIYAAFGLAWDDHLDRDFVGEAVYLADLVASLAPQQAEPAGLLALLMFSHARRKARHVPDDTSGLRFVALHEQDTRLWDKASIDRANQILWHAAGLQQPGPFQLEAAIQSAHCQRLYTGVVPWRGIAQLYEQLLKLAPTLGAQVGHAVAVGESQGADAALRALGTLAREQAVDAYAPFWVAQAYWLAKGGNPAAAIAAYQKALGLHVGAPERQYLQQQINSLLNL